MDIIVELFDAYLFDRLYAAFLPAPPPDVAAYHALKHRSPNATFTSIREAPTPYAYTYRPASKYVSVPPSDYANMSSWPRDNIWRQALTLYLITWYSSSRVPAITSPGTG